MAYSKKSVRRKVQSIVDGDTIKVHKKVSGSQYIRIAGLNAPERGRKGYASAKKNLSRINGKTVTVTPKARSYGRVVANVTYKRKRIRG